VAVDVEGLRWPKHEVGKEVHARDECDEQCQQQDSGILLYSSWEHGELGEFGFPNAEAGEASHSEKERHQNVSRGPWVLVASPLKSCEEQDHAGNAQEATDEIDLLQNLLFRLAKGIDSGRWVVENEDEQEANRIPCADDGANISPARVVYGRVS